MAAAGCPLPTSWLLHAAYLSLLWPHRYKLKRHMENTHTNTHTHTRARAREDFERCMILLLFRCITVPTTALFLIMLRYFRAIMPATPQHGMRVAPSQGRKGRRWQFACGVLSCRSSLHLVGWAFNPPSRNARAYRIYGKQGWIT